MTEAIIVAIIAGAVQLAAVLISNRTTGQRMQSSLEKSQAVTDTKIDELTREVREHNNFAQRVPVLEEKSRWLIIVLMIWNNCHGNENALF